MIDLTKIPVHPAPSPHWTCTHWCVVGDGIPLVAFPTRDEALLLAAAMRHSFEYVDPCGYAVMEIRPILVATPSACIGM